jgi:four helix bundle protein
MPYKLEKLEVWTLSLDYVDAIYEIAGLLPTSEQYNLRSQIVRAATSVALNIAEGGMGQSNLEQSRFLGYSIRSVIETVAWQHLIRRRRYLGPREGLLDKAYSQSETLTQKLYALRKSVDPNMSWVREDEAVYGDNATMKDGR